MFDDRGKLCQSTSPVPRMLSLVAPTYLPAEEDWQSGGWPCLGFTSEEPLWGQFLLVTDADETHCRVVGRRVIGDAIVEYVLEAEARHDDGFWVAPIHSVRFIPLENRPVLPDGQAGDAPANQPGQ